MKENDLTYVFLFAHKKKKTKKKEKKRMEGGIG